MKRMSTLAAGLLIGAAALQFSGVASGQSDGWITLLDSTKKGDWTEVGKANWEMKDGALGADKLEGKDLSYLVSKDSYKDFQIKAEFWTDEEANSGIFIRCDARDSASAFWTAISRAPASPVCLAPGASPIKQPVAASNR